MRPFCARLHVWICILLCIGAHLCACMHAVGAENDLECCGAVILYFETGSLGTFCVLHSQLQPAFVAEGASSSKDTLHSSPRSLLTAVRSRHISGGTPLPHLVCFLQCPIILLFTLVAMSSHSYVLWQG